MSAEGSRRAALGLILAALVALALRAWPVGSGSVRPIAVYARAEAPADLLWSKTAEGGTEPDGSVIDASGAAIGRVEGWRGLLLGRPLDINGAGLLEFEALPGIGRRTAEKIAASREREGGFTAPEDLINVPGIGAAKFKRIRPWVAVRQAGEMR